MHCGTTEKFVEADVPELAPAVTRALSEFIADGDETPLDEDLRELARLHILDTIAAVVVCRDLAASRMARSFATAHSGGIDGGATIPGARERAALLDAVFAGAVTAHAAEINDFSPTSLVQPGASVVPTVLCVSQVRGLNGEAMLRAVVKGYELACRMTRALGLQNLQLAGMSTHSVGGTFGAAAAAASLMRLPAEQVGDVLSCCTQQMSGSRQWLLDVHHIEKAFVFAGMPARNGLHAALLVEAGFIGVPNCLDRAGSWVDSMPFTRVGSDLDRNYLVARLGERYELPRVAFKRYASGGPTQAAIQGLSELLRTVDVSRIETIRVLIPSQHAAAFAVAEMPNLNLPYLFALVALDGRLDFHAAQSRERMLNDPAVRAFMRRVTVERDPDSKSIVETKRSARVEITLTDGTKCRVCVASAKGHPDSPMWRADVEAKALELMAPVLGVERARRIVAVSRDFEELERAGDLLEMMAA